MRREMGSTIPSPPHVLQNATVNGSLDNCNAVTRCVRRPRGSVLYVYELVGACLSGQRQACVIRYDYRLSP